MDGARNRTDTELRAGAIAGLFGKALGVEPGSRGVLNSTLTAPGDGRGTIYLKQAFGDFYYLADGIEEFFSLLRDPTQI